MVLLSLVSESFRMPPKYVWLVFITNCCSSGGDDEPPSAKKETVNGTTASTSKQEKEIVKEEERKKEKEEEETSPLESKRPTVILHSQKMKELKDLLLAEKLNTHAISLHLTAQSQVQVGKKGRGEEGYGVRPKRARRD